MEEVYTKILAKYKTLDFPNTIGEPGHYLIESLLSTWKERGYPEQFKIGNNDLSLKCGTAPTNIQKLRDRVFGEVRLDGKWLLSYKSLGRSQPGVYKVNPDIIAKYKEVKEEPEPIPVKPQETVKPKRGDAWDVIPFEKLPELSETQGISQEQFEILNRFGLNHLRFIDIRYYTPSTTDANLLYELFRQYTPRYIKEQAKEAKEQNIANVLVWIGRGE